MNDPESHFERDPLPSPEVDPAVAERIAEGFGRIFEAEHSLPDRPPQLPTKSPRNDRYSNVNFSVDPGDENLYWTYRKAPSREPTLDERIEHTKGSIESRNIICERKISKTGRSRHNFGTEFHIASEFRLKRTPMLDTDEDAFNVGLENRKSLYRYLQYRGMILVDDTGRDKYTGTKVTPNYAYLMLPKEIEHGNYFALEDEIRTRVPLTSEEIRLQQTLDERAGRQPRSVEEFLVTAPEIMQLVDSLEFEERFVPLFAVAATIREERRRNPRADVGEPEPVREQAADKGNEKEQDIKLLTSYPEKIVLSPLSLSDLENALKALKELS